MPALVTIFVFCGSVCLIIAIRHLLVSREEIHRLWEGAPRHVFALGVGLCAFVVLFSMLQLLDLFERDLFSWSAFFHRLQTSFVLLISGGTIVVAALMLGKFVKRG